MLLFSQASARISLITTHYLMLRQNLMSQLKASMARLNISQSQQRITVYAGERCVYMYNLT